MRNSTVIYEKKTNTNTIKRFLYHTKPKQMNIFLNQHNNKIADDFVYYGILYKD